MIYPTHLLNFICEKCDGRLDLGSLRQYFEHLKDDRWCCYCSPERADRLTKNFGRRITLQHQICPSTIGKHKTHILRFLETYDPELAKEFLKKSWAKRLRRGRQEEFKPRLRETDFEAFVKERIFDNLRLEDGTLVPARRMSLWLQFQFALGYYELSHLRVKDIDFQEEIIQIVRQKTGVHFTIPIYNPKKQIPILRGWLELRQQVLEEWTVDFPYLMFRYHAYGRNNDYIKPWTPAGYRKLIKEMLFQGTRFDKFGIASHEIRRWGASHLHYDAEPPWSICDVQRLLGHNDPATTAKYIQSDIVEWKERVQS